MNARAPKTQHARRVHIWEGDDRNGDWVESVLSLCGGIEAEESFLVGTEDPVDCPGCLRELAEDHDAALARERTYEFHRPRRQA